MARRPATPPEPQPASLTVDQMRRGIGRIQRRIEELGAFDPLSVRDRFAPEVSTLEKSIDETLIAVFGHDTLDYERYRNAKNLDQGPLNYIHKPSLAEVHEYLTNGRVRSVALLRQAIRFLEEEIAEREWSEEPQRITEEAERAFDLTKVFVVHGHDEAAREAVARFIEQIGFEAIILHERPNKGRTIITKFRDEAADVGFAVVLMTPDDIVGDRPRARQNVVFELGFFIGALGPAHVAALVKGDIERPSDFDGVVYISLDTGSWKTALGRELEAAGYTIDWNKVMRA